MKTAYSRFVYYGGTPWTNEAVRVTQFQLLGDPIRVLKPTRHHGPVMKTYAGSFTNCFAVARPMPLLPSVMSAIFSFKLAPVWLSSYQNLSDCEDDSAEGAVFNQVTQSISPFGLIMARDIRKPLRFEVRRGTAYTCAKPPSTNNSIPVI